MGIVASAEEFAPEILLLETYWDPLFLANSHSLKREGDVEGTEVNNKGLYSITPKGKNDYADGLPAQHTPFNMCLATVVVR